MLATIEAERPAVCVIDSVQTLVARDSTPGSVGAVREATAALMDVAKRLDVTMLLIGHVTKEGSLAGPRALEHLVDTVLQFEGERERSPPCARSRTASAQPARRGVRDARGGWSRSPTPRPASSARRSPLPAR